MGPLAVVGQKHNISCLSLVPPDLLMIGGSLRKRVEIVSRYHCGVIMKTSQLSHMQW